MRFRAPPHVSNVHLSTGVHEVKNGVLVIHDKTPQADVGGLYRQGFILLTAPAAPKAKPKDKPAKTPKTGG